MRSIKNIIMFILRLLSGIVVPSTSFTLKGMFSCALLVTSNSLSSEIVDQIIFLNKNKIKMRRN